MSWKSLKTFFFFSSLFWVWYVTSPNFLPPFLRVCQLRQSGVGTGRHPGHERLPDRHEEAQGAAEALQEWQQTLLIVPRAGAFPWLCVSTARVSLPNQLANPRLELRPSDQHSRDLFHWAVIERCCWCHTNSHHLGRRFIIRLSYDLISLHV